jgi:opacity protein-like surface antigen
MLLAVVVGCVAGPAQAQTAAQSGTTSTDRGYAEFTFGPTFGHKASASLGAEVGWWLTDSFGIFGEGGRMLNVASSTIGDHAGVIAQLIGGSADVKQPATYFDAGIVYRIPRDGKLQPYALLGIGGATVTNDVAFKVGGSDVTGSLLDQYGVQLGGDLSGSYSKLFVTVGVGAHYDLTSRWVADISYRYGYIGKNADSELPAISTNRLQFGAGLKF